MTTPADKQITDAIDTALQAYYEAEGVDSLPAGWVLLVSDIGRDMEADESGVVIVYPNGSMPWANALGIVEMGRIRMHSQFGRGES